MIKESTKTKNEKIGVLITYFDHMIEALEETAQDALMDVAIELEMMENDDFAGDEGFSAKEFVPKAMFTSISELIDDIDNRIETAYGKLKRIKDDLANKQTYEETEGNY